MIRRILHPTDFSSAARPAFDRAVALAKAEGATLVVVHVLTPLPRVASDGYVTRETYDRVEAATRAAATKQLAALVAKARKAGVTTTGRLLEGLPHEAIVRAARTAGADLIVMGTQGRTGLARVLLGSVAGRVAATSRTPVMTVRGR